MRDAWDSYWEREEQRWSDDDDEIEEDDMEISQSVWEQCWEGVPEQELEKWEHEGQDGNLYACRYALKNGVHHYGAYLERDVWCIVTGEREGAHEALYTWIQIHSILKSGEQQ